MTDADITINNMLIAHRDAVNAIAAFSLIFPLDNDFHPLIELLSSNLQSTFDGLFLAAAASDSSGH